MLRRLGVSAPELRQWERDGTVQRIRRGYYARPDARTPVVRAVRLGGRLTSYPALEAHGAWCPPDDDRLHVAVNAHARLLRDPDTAEFFRPRSDVVLHWKDVPPPRSGQITGLSLLPTAIRHLPADLDHAHLVAVLDSAVRARSTTTAQLAAGFGGTPRLLRVMRLIDPSAESGTESIARVRMLEAGIEPRCQAKIGRWRVDFLISRRVVVEVDGREFHDDESTFTRDRRKAAELTALGLHVLHFSYAQVLYDWPTCLAAIRRALLL